MENKNKKIGLIALAVFCMVILVCQYDLPKAYALTITNFNTTGSPNFFNKAGNNVYVINTTTGALRGYNLLTGTQLFSVTADTTGATFRGFRCDTSDCWQMRVQSTTDCYITRISALTGAQEEQVHYSQDCNGSSDIGIYQDTLYFGRKCTTGDIGSSGAGDTDLAVFSVNKDSMAGTPVQHTDCGSNFTPVSSSSQGIIGYKGTSSDDDIRLAVIINGAAGAADIFRYINLQQTLTSTQNTVMCSATFGSTNTFNSAQGRNIQFIGLTAYVNGFIGSGADTTQINTVTSTCSVSNTSTITAFNAAQADLSLDTTRHILYLGGTEADATGLLVVGYNFTSNTATSTALTTITPDATLSSIGWDYTLGSNIGYVLTSAKVFVLDFGGGTDDEENTGGIDCTDPDFSYRLICNIPDNSGLTGASNLINQSGTNIVCQIGLLHCTQGEDGNFTPDNSDITTNGIGYLLTIIAIGIFVGILWVASRGQLTEIPTFIWFIGTIAILGSMTAFGWIDPTFLIIGVIAIIAFAVAKVKGVFGGQTTFAGEMA